MTISTANHIIIFVIAILLGLFFYCFPDLDLLTSGWFYDHSQHFYLAHEPLVLFIHRLVPLMATAFVVGCFVWMALIWWRTRSLSFKAYLSALYLLTCCALGPGVMVHYVMKDHFQRARPSHSVEFGGSLTFTPAFVVATECKHNCSFVSGHASVGFLFYSFAFIMPWVKRRKAVLAASTLMGSIFGLGRIIEGGHFLSDVVFAGFVVYFTCYFMYLVFIKLFDMERI